VNVFDLLGQVQRAFRYARSWGSLFTSLGIVCVLTGLTFDFLYGFLYRRIDNTPHTHYGPLYWVILVTLCALLPLAYAAYRVTSWLLLLRPFPPDKLGIAIAQFEVWSASSGQLSQTDRVNAMSQVIPTFFQTLRSRLSDDPQWSESFVLKFLPPTLHIRNAKDAKALLGKQHATLVVWGLLVQKASGALQIELHLAGDELEVRLTGSMDDFSFLDTGSLFIKANSLMGAAMTAKRNQDYQACIRFMQMALIPAGELDQRADDAKQGFANAIKANLDKVQRLASGLLEADAESAPAPAAGTPHADALQGGGARAAGTPAAHPAGPTAGGPTVGSH
jgi:hypothetical protein